MQASKHPLYGTWKSMRRRCISPNYKQWPDYGGRGIRVCDRWQNDFWSFASDMGDRPTGHTLERIDNDGDYTPDNCRWATRSEQLRNRRNNAVVTIEGRTYKVFELADKYGIDRRYIVERARRGLSFSEVIYSGRFHGKNVRPAIRARVKASKERTHCKRGHELTPENIAVTATGARSCRLCRNLTVREWRRRKAQK